MLGSQVGPYRIESELGTGGMGTVYLAEVAGTVHGLDLGQRVALKIVHPHLLATPGFFKRFLQEADVGRRIQHTNVVRTYEVDATLHEEKQVNYMAMEFVEGRSLRDLAIELGTVPETLLREIAMQIAAGLQAVHAEGIVHRDIKPENVLITDDQRVRIMDLGVAKLQEASIAITKEGQFTGSLLYAAPEQCDGREVGAAADLYSLGVMLYELATGQNPFRHDDAVAVIKAHMLLEPPPVHDKNPELSRFVSEVISCLLQKDPRKRFANAEALMKVLSEGEDSVWWAEREKLLRTVIAELPKIQVRRETELRGRDKELEAIQDAWKRAKDGHGNTVLVEGEAGIGKTRVVDAFMRSLAGQEAHVLYGSYPPSGGIGGLSDAILGKFGRTGTEEALKPYLTVTASLIPAFVALVKHESAPTGAEPLQGDALHAVCSQLAQALAEEKPVVWVVDELHFAPAESRKLILSMARAIGGHRVLLIATTRSGQVPEDELAHFSRLENFKRVELGRLSPRQVIELLSEAFGSELLAEKLGGKIAFKSDGIPFFIFEMIRGLKEGRFITEQADGSFAATKVIEDIDVPSAVRDLIGARLGDLSDENRNLLDAASVQGAEFDPELVARVLDMKQIQVLQRLAAMERRSGVVRAHGPNYRFDHHQIQEILYADLSEALRRGYHALLAEAYEQREGIDGRDESEIPGEQAFILASHHLRGNQPKAAKRYITRALSHLRRAYRSESAVQIADLVLAVPGLLDDEQRVDVLLRKSSCLVDLARPDRTIIEEAVAVADQSGNRQLMGSTRQSLAMQMWREGLYEDGLERAHEALAIATELGDDGLAQRVHTARGLLYWNMARFDEGREAMTRALESDSATSHNNLGVLELDCGNFDVAREHLRHALEGADSNVAHGMILENLAAVSWNLGEYAQAKDEAERSLAKYNEIGNLSRLWDPTRILGLTFASLGRLEKARETLAHARESARAVGHQRGESYALHGLGWVAEQGGKPEEAERRYTQALILRREIKYPLGIADSLVALGRLHLENEAETAAQELEEALEVSSEIRAPAARALAIGYLAKLGRMDPEQAEAAFAEDESKLGVATQLEAHLLLGHRDRAKALLRRLADHAPEEHREAMVENVRLHREITAAS